MSLMRMLAPLSLFGLTYVEMYLIRIVAFFNLLLKMHDYETLKALNTPLTNLYEIEQKSANIKDSQNVWKTTQE